MEFLRVSRTKGYPHTFTAQGCFNSAIVPVFSIRFRVFLSNFSPFLNQVKPKSIISIQIQKDGVGLKGTTLRAILPYGTTWQKVNSMCLSNGNLFISHAQGTSKIILETSCECRLVVELDDQPCVVTRFGTDVLYTNHKKVSIWQLSDNGRELRLFAGSDEEDGSTDGPVKESCSASRHLHRVWNFFVMFRQTQSRSAAS